MNSQEILLALRTGQLSREEAKKLLSQDVAPAQERASSRGPEVHNQGLSGQKAGGNRKSGKPAEALPVRKDAVAIIGMSGRYPGAADLDRYWANLEQGKNSIREVPPSRWDMRRYYDPRRQQKEKIYCKWMGALEDIETFDAFFFMVPPSEAELMDPQQRIFLEEGYKAFEDAGYGGPALNNKKCGVYLGMMSNEYGMLLQKNGSGTSNLTGNSAAIAAARISYHLNLKGPAISIDTACSSSLVAAHLACQALLNGEIDMALVGGVTLYLMPESYIGMCAAGMLSPRGECSAFDNSADGFVPGEGAGALVLKRLRDAEADRDSIYGVIIGSGINQDGRTNGITAPSVNSQIELEREVYARYGINPDTISYAELHGTGTKLGDPVELEALSTVFREKTKRKNFCAIGSVKTNIGHTSAAAGVAGVHKVLLSLQWKRLLPTLNFRSPNEHFDFTNSPFYVNTGSKPWDSPDGSPRRACVSAFGFSGTNAHMVIEEYRPENGKAGAPASMPTKNPVLFVLSAKGEEQLENYAKKMKSFIETNPDMDPADVAYTLQTGRDPMDHRLAFAADSREAVLKALAGFLERDASTGVATGHTKKNRESLSILESDTDMASLVSTWIQQKKLKEVAEVWAKGLNIDWNILYGKSRPRRINLPAYAFARERYWAPEADAITRGSVTASAGAPALQKDRLLRRSITFLKKEWEPCPSKPAGSLSRAVAILTTKETRELAALLAGYFPESRILDPNDTEQQTGQPGQHWKQFDGCVDLAGCGKERIDATAWTAWLQQLIEYGRRDGLTILCATKGLESYQNSEMNLSGASRAGLYRMLQTEYRHLKSRHVDGEQGVEDSVLAEQVAAELLADTEDAEVCYRSGKRHRAVLRELQEENDCESFPAVPAGHVLWITGGTRGLGYLCARHFVEKHGITKLVLTGREELPPREQWGSDRRHTESIARKIRAVQELEARGAEVRVLSVSLTNEQALSRSIDEIRKTLGPAGGVIHCAGVTDEENPAFIRKSEESIRRVLDPKTAGLNAVYQSFHKEPLRFFVLFSSVSATIPVLAAGQSDYAMANGYMDYFAEANRRACPIVSIQWPNWKETGMGAVENEAYRRTGLLGMTDGEGLQLLDRVLSGNKGPVILPAVVDPDIWKPHMLMRRRLQDVFRDAASPGSAFHPSDSADALVNATRSRLVDLFSLELKMDPSRIETGKRFPDYGIDSILLAQVLRSMNQWLATDLDLSVLLEHSTIESLAAWLVNNHSAALSKVFGLTDADQGARPAAETLPPLPAGLSVIQSRNRAIPGEGPRRGGVDPLDIAVVGLSCRFPEADNLDEYWMLLSEGRTAIRAVPEERWGYASAFYAGLLADITRFDPAFFLIAQEDARAMDPQALLALEESLKLFHHAGYSLEEIKGRRAGVYIGARSNHRPDESSLRRARNPIIATGHNYLAANISRFFDLHGPSIVVDTACSSALVGMDMALHGLRTGEIESAIVGGVNLLTSDSGHRVFQQRGILSNEPFFHIFDRRAGGIVPGEGAGVVLLKTVEQARKDGDRIYAVVKALAVNSDGRTAGPAAPNPESQKEIMQTVLRRSGKKPDDITYIEANGSGSEVTDLLELRAIQSVYRSSGAAPCGLGSVKPNIGHPLCAEGIAGFIKVVLMLHHRKLVPFLSGEVPMNHYDIGSSPFYFCREAGEWAGPRAAAINCFADGGTNSHAILEAWEEQAPAGREPLPAPALQRHSIREEREFAVTIPGNGRGHAASAVRAESFAPEGAAASDRIISIWKQPTEER